MRRVFDIEDLAGQNPSRSLNFYRDAVCAAPSVPLNLPQAYQGEGFFARLTQFPVK
jgi:hypothetical protein